MCGRYALFQTGRLDGRFDADWHQTRISPVVPRYNIAPSDAILTVMLRHGRRVLEPAIWGLRPFWMHNGRIPPPINAKAETLLERPMWKGALRSCRCLIPADGFYEWLTPPASGIRQPYFIRLRDEDLFAFAGLYAEDVDGNPTAAIITTSSVGHPLMEPLHHRMPAILRREDEAAWLDPGTTRAGPLLGLLATYPAEGMVAYPVARDVGNVRNEGPDLIVPIEG